MTRIAALPFEQTAASAQIQKLKDERATIEKSIAPATQEFEAVRAERDKAVAALAADVRR